MGSWHDGRVNEAQVIERAQQLWTAGSRTASINLLKERARQDPVEWEVRRLLAQRYRELKAPDQAGRWGIALPGWTTAFERDRLARMIAASGVGAEDVHRLLALPASELTADVDQVLAEADRYRERFNAKLRERDEPTPEARWEIVAMVSWAAVVVIFVVEVLVLWVGSLLDGSMTMFARWASFAALIPLTLGCLAIGWGRFRHSRRSAAAGWLFASAVLLVALTAFVAVALGHGGAIVFSWEG